MRLKLLPLILVLATGAAHAAPDPANYPLRLQVLGSTARTHLPTNPFAGGGSGGGEGMDIPNLMGSGPELERDSTPVFYGQGWADFFFPEGPQALTFTYDNCANRIAASMPHAPLFARWKTVDKVTGKPTVLEVLVPLEIQPDTRHPDRLDKQRFTKCDIPITFHNYVFLRLRDGSITRVTRQAYAKKPSLSQFVDGAGPTLQPRVPPAK